MSNLALVLVFVGYRTNIARYVAKWGIAQMCLCETKYQGGASHHFRGVPLSLKSAPKNETPQTLFDKAWPMTVKVQIVLQ